MQVEPDKSSKVVYAPEGICVWAALECEYAYLLRYRRWGGIIDRQADKPDKDYGFWPAVDMHEMGLGCVFQFSLTGVWASSTD